MPCGGALPVYRILFASSSLETSHRPVLDALQAQGHEVIVYPVDKILAGTARLHMYLSDAGMLEVLCAGASIAPRDLDAAWYWKPLSFRIKDAERHIAKQQSLVNEMRLVDNSLWGLYPDDLWLNSPTATWAGNRKLPQLVLAQELGFVIPSTLLTNDWADVQQHFLQAGIGQIAAKMHGGVIAIEEKVRGAYTTVLDADSVAALAPTTSPFPGLIQPYLTKYREWRVTVVREQVFAVTIYTKGAARSDWRRYQTDPASVRFQVAELPGGIADLCIEYLKRSDLGYGAFDLIETAEGHFVFLECNPSGQYLWLEEGLGVRIADAIAQALVDISTVRG